MRGCARSAAARSRITRFRGTWEFVSDAFPMTVTGKVQKFKLRERAIDELDLSAPASVQTA